MKARTQKLSTVRSWLLIAGLTALTPTLLAVPTFQYLRNGPLEEDLPGGSVHSIALSVSADGRFVVGESSSASSGVINPDIFSTNREGFIWDAATDAMTALGDIAGGRYSSVATGVSADGNVVVGYSEDLIDNLEGPRFSPFRWTPATGMVRLNGARICAIAGFGGAVAVTSDGTRVAGYIEWMNQIVFAIFQRGFTWTQGSAEVTFLDRLDVPVASRWPATGCPSINTQLNLAQEAVFAMSPNGSTVAGIFSTVGEPWNLFRKQGAGLPEDLGRIGEGPIRPRAISADGTIIVGSFTPTAGQTGAFRWQENSNPALRFVELRASGGGATGISANGRIMLDEAGGLYFDDQGPFDLREILAETGVMDLRHLTRGQFDANALSADGLVIVGRAFVSRQRAWRVRLTDCDENGLPDELERRAYPDRPVTIAAQGSGRFASSRSTLGYGDMVSHYGRPWPPGENRVPAPDSDHPAEALRALTVLSTCVDGAIVSFLDEAERFFFGTLLPSARELHAFEMLLGNEAFSDALDPTVGEGELEEANFGDYFAFQGVNGIPDLIDEELALLRGRELPGEPAEWLDEETYYPEYVNPADEDEKRSVAVYNRLPPNADGLDEEMLAYQTNYGGVASNFEAAERFPQGHGDAYGHFLTALKTGIRLLSRGTEGIPPAFLDPLLAAFAANDGALESVRSLATAAVARAETTSNITDLLFRRDYRENTGDPRAAELFADPDPERAWSMGDWARRGALGAYLDWAVVNHLAPTDEARPVNRLELAELEELAAAAGALQERLDTAGAGLDPLGLMQNVVPFGIDASGLTTDKGSSHYEQVRAAAERALENAGKAFRYANQAGQRLRESGNSFEEFAENLEDTKVDFDQQLIEVFGLPSRDDPADNDDDERTSDFVESESRPDLVRFFLDDEGLAAEAMQARKAPGEVQIALSELKVASLRLEQAELAIDELEAQIQSQLERIDKVVGASQERRQIIDRSCNEQFDVVDRTESLQRRKKLVGLGGQIGAGLVSAFSEGGNPSELVGALADGVNLAWDEIGDNEFDIEREKIRIQCQREADMQFLEDQLNIDSERRQLKALFRQIPQRLVERSVQQELARQSLGRLRQAINRGQLLLTKKHRLEARTEGQLLRQRWQDMSFRVFRNAALKNYRALFDIAARYVVLAGRAYAYEYNKRSTGADILSGIYRERRLGTAAGAGGGLHAVVRELDANAEVDGFNQPFEETGDRGFSFRINFLGIDNEAPFPEPDLRFRTFLEGCIVERIQDLREIQDLAQVSVDRDHGPGLVIPFATELQGGRNFFGRGPGLPFGNDNFSQTRNIKIRSFAILFDGVDPSPLGTSGTVWVYLIPAGDSVLRENTNQPRIEDEAVTQWAVVDQFLPPPAVIGDLSDLATREYNPWRSLVQSGGSFPNTIKRLRDSEARVDLGGEYRFNTHLAGRSVWNTRWLLIIPGRQWTDMDDPQAIRHKLREFIYGKDADPTRGFGITDIRLVIQGYTY